MTAVARKNVDALLPAHPHYELLLKKDAPAGADLKLWVFLQATTWPDMVRPGFGPNQRPKEITRYHNGTWHYINKPYVWQSDAAKFSSAALATGGDLLVAIEKCRQSLGDRSKPAADRAVHLAWLLHLIGDLHQPLHSSIMYSARAMKGDQGGNLVAVRRGNGVVKLHSYWDGALGSGESMNFIRSIAHGLTSTFLADDALKTLPELRAKTPDAWVDESFAAAVEYAYVKGELQWRPSSDWDKQARPGSIHLASFRQRSERPICALRLNHRTSRARVAGAR